MSNGKSWYQIRNAAKPGVAEILLYDEIGYFGITAAQFARELQGITAGTIHLRINSPGGSVFDGYAVYNSLRSHPARVITEIEGLAASIASLIALAGDEVRAAENSFVMIHNCSYLVAGGAEDMRHAADLMETIDAILARAYAAKTGKSQPEMQTLMNDETWLTAHEAKSLGLVDVVTNPLKVAASFDLSKFGKAPADVRARLAAGAGAASAEIERRIAAVKTDHPDWSHAKCVCAVYHADVDLHRRYVAEANARPTAAAHKLTGATAVGEFERRVREAKASGASSADAVRSVVGADPALHAAYLAAKNPVRSR